MWHRAPKRPWSAGLRARSAPQTRVAPQRPLRPSLYSTAAHVFAALNLKHLKLSESGPRSLGAAARGAAFITAYGLNVTSVNSSLVWFDRITSHAFFSHCSAPASSSVVPST